MLDPYWRMGVAIELAGLFQYGIAHVNVSKTGFHTGLHRAAQYNMTVSIEPIERGRFKNLILGPTWECAAFIKDMQEKGASNAKLILDIAHLPLMGEEIGGAVKSCMARRGSPCGHE